MLVVDDHRELLEKVSATLADSFDVAGIATDGRQALDAAPQVNPEAIVLDIHMPGLDGFQTIRALQHTGSRAPVVFLSMYDAEEFVAEAFRRGGRGYVLKTHVARDLPGALEQVLLGRLFVPSLTSLFHLVNGGGDVDRGRHAMQLHRDLESFLDGLALFFEMALRRGDATCLISTEPVREGLASRLRTRGWDVGGPSGHKRYRALDAADALKSFMRDGLPDAALLAHIAAELEDYRLGVTKGAASRLTIFGNMVELLITNGQVEGAIALESQWNRLTHGLRFFTLCGYCATWFHEAVGDLWPRACAEHWAVSHASGV